MKCGHDCLWEQITFKKSLELIQNDEDFRTKTGKINQQYIEKNKGATEKVMKYIHKNIQK